MPVHVALRQVGYGECGRRRRGNRIPAAFDTVDDNSRLPARLIGGKLAVLAERHPLRTAPPPALHNVDLSAGGIDPDPKAGQIVIPEHGILALDGEQIDGAFGDRQIVSFGDGGLPTAVQLDNATGYKHLHYGLWNGLSGSDANTITDLGIGFVTALSSGMGMTDPNHEAEGGMPNFGSATYNGNWVANVQAADEQGDGGITRQDGLASMTVDFVKDEVDVILSGLATLEGSISGNTFSGAGKPTLNATLTGDLASATDFMGGFSGGFFGPSAAEAGGIFDYASKDNKNGAFRGSFGGDQN